MPKGIIAWNFNFALVVPYFWWHRQIGPPLNQLLRDAIMAFLSGFMRRLWSTLNVQFFYLGATPVSLLWILEAVICFGALVFFFKATVRPLRQLFLRLNLSDGYGKSILFFACRLLLLLLATVLVVHLLGIAAVVFGSLAWLYQQVEATLDLRLFTLGKSPITVMSSIYLAFAFWLIVFATAKLNDFVSLWLKKNTRLDDNIAESLAASARYSLLLLGLVVVIQSAGIDLSALAIVAGALGIAIGLALKDLTNNLVSGIVILFEQPVKIGDYIDAGGIAGHVARVSLRATTVITSDNAKVIVPNSLFITSKIVNWTQAEHLSAVKIPLVVSAGADALLVKDVLLHVASGHEAVLETPPPVVLLEEFSDTSFKFNLKVWTKKCVSAADQLKSELNFAVLQELEKQGVMLGSGAESAAGGKDKDTQLPRSLKPSAASPRLKPG